MTTIEDIAAHLESVAPLSYQEDYDNAGLLTGSHSWVCSGALCALDATEAVIQEAVARKCNLVVAHHPIIFRGLKKINGKHPVEKAIITAIKNDIAIYAIHTNLDNVADGVNGRIADRMALDKRRALAPGEGGLKKLFTFVPVRYLEQVRAAIFAAGGGQISRYSECSFVSEGTGSFKPGEGTHPFAGSIGVRQEEPEMKLEVILPAHLEQRVLKALFSAHPYEEVAYDLVSLTNTHAGKGSGLCGELPAEMEETAFLSLLKDRFGVPVIRHTPLTGKGIRQVAVCGGAGSFLIPNALKAGVQAFVTSDLKYHEFFEADGNLLLCDIGHFESEQFTTELLIEILLQKFPNFAVLKSEVKTNPVNYFIG